MVLDGFPSVQSGPDKNSLMNSRYIDDSLFIFFFLFIPFSIALTVIETFEVKSRDFFVTQYKKKV